MTLLPGLPDDVALECLVRVPRHVICNLGFVCSSWRRVSSSDIFKKVRLEANVAEGWIYVLAGSPTDIKFKAFDPKCNKWYDLPPAPEYTPKHSWEGFACVALASTLILMGGVRRKFNEARQELEEEEVCGDVFLYDAFMNQWSRGVSMLTPRSWFAASVVEDRVFVAGGQGRNSFLTSAEMFDPKLNAWNPIADIKLPRSSCVGMSMGDKFWVIAGEIVRNSNQGRFILRGSAEVFDPTSGKWKFIPEMWVDSLKVPGPNTIYKGKILAFCNEKLMTYEESGNYWKHVGSMGGSGSYQQLDNRFGFACISLEPKVYLVGGLREWWENYRTYNVKPVNSIEECNLSNSHIVGSSKLTHWKKLASMGPGDGGVILSSVVLWL
ncbi:hypothetical protein O6H91_17G065000 [Diphasiastrum complanatum]|uniref:Uncharacterized protein n=1 Tax=Diphasiastrum complanatum TaxID=34168 RepID=A0ACC2B7R7_DIPCM|nr:hypothetical protein O6H91_Y194900 [Diphasiastrum complanatum]KAJ7525764.1 hypothetical protein O6H91_17G065000 [Diphasiastrum complanatum]